MSHLSKSKKCLCRTWQDLRHAQPADIGVMPPVKCRLLRVEMERTYHSPGNNLERFRVFWNYVTDSNSNSVVAEIIIFVVIAVFSTLSQLVLACFVFPSVPCPLAVAMVFHVGNNWTHSLLLRKFECFKHVLW